MRIYKIFKNVATSSALSRSRPPCVCMLFCMVFNHVHSGANIHRVGSKTTGTKTASTNKAERTAIAETLEGKVADMTKMITSSASGAKGKGRGKSKGKKVHRGLRLPTILPRFNHRRWFRLPSSRN